MTLALFLLLLPNADVPTAEQLMARHLQASGLQAASAKPLAVVRKGCFELSPNSPCLPFEAYSKSPAKWQFRFTIPDVRFYEQGSDGKSAWAHDDDGPTDLSANDRRQLDWALDPQFPSRLGGYFETLQTTGKRTVAGREVWVVEAKPRGADKPVEVEFDAATSLVARIGDVGFEDYRAVDGMQLPFTIRFIDSRASQRLIAKEIQVNATVEDSRFDRQASFAAYRRDLDAMWLPQLETALRGIDAGPARAVLGELRNFPPPDGRMLYDVIVEHGYRRAVEIGTATGNSTLWIALGLKKTGGKLITIEKNADLAKIAAANFKKAGLADVVECRNADAFQEIPALQGDFDFLFLDTGTALHKKFMDLVYPARLKDGGAVVSHNSNDLAKRQPDFLKAITGDPNLTTKITPTPGGGVSVSIRAKQQS